MQFRSVMLMFAGILIPFVLSACGSVSPSPEPAAQSASRVPEDGWREVHPGVEVHATIQAGGVYGFEGYRVTTAEGLEWLAGNLLAERKDELRAQLEQAGTEYERIVLTDRLGLIQRLIDRAQLLHSRPLSADLEPTQSCTASAYADIGNFGYGASAYASATNCSYFNDGGVDTYAFAGGNSDSDSDTLSGYGTSGSAGASAPSPTPPDEMDCYARAEAVGYPDAFQAYNDSFPCDENPE